MKRKLALSFPQGNFFRGVLTLAGGSASAQVLTILVAPLLTRLYTPEDFGLLAVYASILGLIAVVATLRYEMAIPIAEADQVAANIVGLSFLVLLGSTLLISIVLGLVGSSLAAQMNMPLLSSYSWLIPVGVLLGGIYNIFNYWAVRSKHFSSISNAVVSQSVVSVTIQVLGSVFGSVALVVGTVAGQGVGSVRLARLALTQPVFKGVSWLGIKQAAFRYKNFPIFSSAAGLINSLGYQAAPLIIAALIGPAAAGVYALASRVVTMPAALIGGAVGSVFLSDAPEQHRLHRLGSLVEKVHEKLSILAAPPAVFLIFFGPQAFAFVFGEDWRISGEFARWLALPLYAAFVTSPLSVIFAVVEKQKVGLYMQAVLMLARLLPLIYGISTAGLQFGVACFSIGSFIGYLVYAIVAFRVARVPPGRIAYCLVIDWIVAFVCIAPLVLASRFDENMLVISAAALVSLFLLFFHLKRMTLSFKKAK